MNIDDPKFTAYALNALPVGEKEAVEPGILSDKELWHEAEVTAAFAEKLKRAFTAEHNARLSEAHWREIFAEVGVEESPRAFPPEQLQPRRLPVWALSAAAGVMAGAVIASIAITWGEHPRLLAESKPAKLPPVIEKPASMDVVPVPPHADLPVAGKPEVQSVKQRPFVAFVPRPVSESVVASRTPDTVVKVAPAFGGARNSTPSSFVSQGAVSVAEFLPTDDGTESLQDVPAQTASIISLPIVRGGPLLVAPTKPASVAVAPTVSVAANNVNNQKSISVPDARKKSTVPQNLAGTFVAGGTGKASAVANDLIFSTAPALPRNDANRVSPRIAIASDVGNAGIERTTQLNTLGDVNALMEHDGALTASFAASDLILSGQSGIFSLRSNPDVKYTIVLDNVGIPLRFAPSSTTVLEVSAPFTIPSAP